MIDRFTEAAREAISLAAEAAETLGDSYVGTAAGASLGPWPGPAAPGSEAGWPPVLPGPQSPSPSAPGSSGWPPGKDTSIVLNGTDHIRIQLLSPGLNLEALWKQGDKLDDYVSGIL